MQQRRLGLSEAAAAFRGNQANPQPQLDAAYAASITFAMTPLLKFQYISTE